MIVLSPDALADIERLRTFLDRTNPGAARRAMAAILMAIERLQEFPDLGMTTGDADIVRSSSDSAPPVISSATQLWLKRVIFSSRASGTAARHGFSERNR
jgi:plasmid stabilization system protein ParE